MSFKTLLVAASIAAFPIMAFGGDIMVKDAYARASSPAAKAGAAFMEIHNMGGTDDRLIAAASDAAKRVELHTHIDAGDGIMKMAHVKEGFVIGAGDTLMLDRGGNHVMFMGLNGPFEQGARVSVTLSFEKAGDIVVEVPVDLQRKPAMKHGGHGDHSN